MTKQAAGKKYPPVKKVSQTEHIAVVREIFATITPAYDLLNHLMSFRRDVAWRHFAAKRMRLFHTNRVLDVATGTADLGLAVALRHSLSRIVGLDFVEEMIRAGRSKICAAGLSNRVMMLSGDALRLPFAEETFDVAAMAFGIRNIPDKVAALKEMARVVVSGGQVMVLEMTFPRTSFRKRFWQVYLNVVLPCMGRIFSPNPAAYRYLADSIMNFPSPHRLSKLMEKAGLRKIRSYPLTLGITCLHVGIKPEL